MEQLLTAQNFILKGISHDFERFLGAQINWSYRLIGIKGPRGAGKTTLMLQRMKFSGNLATSLYASADHPFFFQHQLYDLGADFAQRGGTHLYIDEVHKYPRWSRELKSLHDSFPQLFIIFSSSSALEIFRGEADLSRRVSVYELPGMSFREYLTLQHGFELPSFGFEDIVHRHLELVDTLPESLYPLAHFPDYLRYGYLPFTREMEPDEYLKRLQNIITTTLESDLLLTKGYSAANTQKIKRLLGTLAEMVPYAPNISALARNLGIGRDTVLEYLTHLQQARLLNFLYSNKTGVSGLRKPHKILLENPNLSYAFHAQPNVGTLRESFALSQLLNAGLEVAQPDQGDLLVDGTWTMEVGGKKKDGSQLRGLSQAFVAADDLHIGSPGKVPLWLLGFLY